MTLRAAVWSALMCSYRKDSKNKISQNCFFFSGFTNLSCDSDFQTANCEFISRTSEKKKFELWVAITFLKNCIPWRKQAFICTDSSSHLTCRLCAYRNLLEHRRLVSTLCCDFSIRNCVETEVIAYIFFCFWSN